MYKVAAMVERLAEGDEDFFDDSEMKMSELGVIRYPYGTKVKIITGRYTGEIGTVKEPTRTMTGAEDERNYWVHLDGDDDPLSAIVYRPEQLERLVNEDEEEEEDFKEVGQGYPQFQIQPAGSAGDNNIFWVSARGEYLGSVTQHYGGGKPPSFYVSFVARRKIYTHVPVDGPDEAATLLWQDHTGIIKLPELKAPYEPLLPPPDDPNHYEAQEWNPQALVHALAEEEDDADELKDYNYDQLDMITQSLRSAGFNVTRAERDKGEMTVEFSWPAEGATNYLNGWKRAREVMKPYITLRQSNFVVRKEAKNGVVTALAIIRKRIEEDPTLWKIVPFNKVFQGSGWFRILFSGEKVGQIYLESFTGADDTAERVREEMAELNEIVPFRSQEWDGTGNEWGHGPAVEWWKQNRSKLNNPDRNKHFFHARNIGK